MSWLSGIFGNWNGLPKNYRHFGLKPMDALTSYETLSSYGQKFNAIFKNPAMLKVVALQCSTFSLGRFYVYDKGGQTLLDDPFVKLMRRPNMFQYQQQFLWEWMLWKMVGGVYIYLDRDTVEPRLSGAQNVLQVLDPSKLEIPQALKDRKDKIITSTASYNEIMKTEVTYRYSNGDAFKFPYGKLIFIPDLPTSDDHFTGRSRIDALYKVIANSEAALDSLNINTRYSGKFLVAGMQDPNDVTRLPLSEPEKKDIERKVDSNKPVEAVKSMIEIRRFVENAGNQKLDSIYLNQYFIIGSMYNIPKDVLEAFNSGTYENQEKARGSHVAYSLQPDGDLLATALADRFGYSEQDKTVEIDWEHLPFMQVFAEQRARAKYTQTQALNNLLKAGVTHDSVNAFLDTEFEFNEQKPKSNGTQQEVQPGAGESDAPGEEQEDGANNT